MHLGRCWLLASFNGAAPRMIATVHGQILAKNKPAGGLLVEIKLPVS
jgi:hypothetical protein